LRHRLRVVAERGRVADGAIVVSHRQRIETHGVGDVEGLSLELDELSFGQLPSLAHARIDIEEAGANEVIALAGLTGIGEAERREGSIGIGKSVGITVDVVVDTNLRRFADEYGISSQFPVGRPVGAVIDAEWEAAGEPDDSSERPSAKECINKAIGVVAPGSAVTEGQRIDKVAVELMFGVEIGEGIELAGIPGVDDLSAGRVLGRCRS
jgi:hypothetical protein